MSAQTLFLGPFTCESPIARGGMATVWRGGHRATGLPVAIKVVDSEKLRGTRGVQALQNEVRAVAALDHPCVVRVLDQGRVPAEVSAWEARLPEGAPWMAMERGAGSAGDRTVRPASWPELRALLMQVLEALAHAHARGLVHRDIKPDNVLWFPQAADGATWKLTDFGIAHHLSDTGVQGMAGTPRCMAPEQVRGRPQDFGPWTDLYGLGCTAWILATGKAPFRGSMHEVVTAHLSATPPALTPVLEVPDGLDGWLRTLLKKRPDQRFSSAAAAAAALADVVGDLREPAELDDLQTTQTWHTLLAPAPLSTTVSADTELAHQAGNHGWEDDPTALPSRGASANLSVPRDWRGQVRTRVDGVLQGAGLGLFHARIPPMIGRQAQRDALWSALGQAERGAQPVVLRLVGPPGMGRSRLAEWVGIRGHELVGLSHFRVVAGPLGLAGLAAELLRCADMHEGEATHTITRILRHRGAWEPWLAQTLLAMVGSLLLQDADSATVAPVSPGQAAAAAGRLLQLMLAGRTGVLWMEDAGGGLMAEQLVDVLRQQAGPLPLLVVLDGGVVREGETEVTVGPIAPALRPELQESWLALEPGLAGRVISRSDGRPAVTRQILQGLVEGALLEPGPEGFGLPAPATLELPAEASDVVARRLERWLAERPAPWGLWLERAVVWGPSIEPASWQALTEADPTALEALSTAWLHSGWAEAVPGGWRIMDDLTREALLARAREAQRLAAHHAACAQVLGAGEDPVTQWRLGRHLARSGDWERACDALMLATRDGRGFLSLQVIEGAMGEVRALLDQHEVPARDSRRGRWHTLRARVLMYTLKQRAAIDELQAATPCTDPEVVQERLHLLCLLHAREGESELARQMLEQMEQIEVFSPYILAFDRGVFHQKRSELQPARAELERAVALASDGRRKATAQRQLAYVCQEAGDLQAARAYMEQAAALHEAEGRRADAGMSRVGLGAIHKALGELDQAASQARSAVTLLDSVGSRSVAVALLNLAVAQLALKRVSAAHRSAERARRLLARSSNAHLLAGVHSTLLVCRTHRGQWDLARREVERLAQLIREHRLHHVELAASLERAGQDARAGGQDRLAVDCLRMAASAWRHRGDTQRADDIERDL